MREGWQLARGSCGFNVEPPVYGAYVNGNALFVFKTHLPDWYCGVVCGHMSTGGETLDKAMARAEEWSNKLGIEGSDHRVSKKQFAAILADPTCLYTGVE